MVRAVIRVLLLCLLGATLVAVASVHYGGFLAAEWLHLYVFEPLEIRLAAMIGWVHGPNPRKEDDERRTS